MRVELPSGGWVEVKDTFTPGDRWAVRDAPDTANDNGKVVVTNAEANAWKTFFMIAVTAWSFPQQIPGQAGPQVIEECIDLDDLDVLEEKLRPVYQKVVGYPNSRRTSRPQPTSGTSPAS